MKPQLTPQEALIYAMVTVAAADRTISEHELGAHQHAWCASCPPFAASRTHG